MKRFEGKTAIITGAASGMGKATAIAFAREAANVVIADINLQGAEAVVDTIRENGGTAIACACDIGDADQIDAMIGTVMENYGRIDILDNNAADLGILMKDADLLNTDMEVWDQTYRVTQRGAMLVSKAALPHMIARGSGVIINISSSNYAAGDVSRFSYSMAKAAIVTLTKCMATTYGRHGIRCNAIAPGLVLEPHIFEMLPAEAQQIWRGNILTPALGQPSHVAETALFLASDEAAYITGQTLLVDGGLLSHTPHFAQFEANPSLPR